MIDYTTSLYHKTKVSIDLEDAEIKQAIINPMDFNVLYERYFLDIYKYIYNRVGDKVICDEVCSSVFLKAMQNLNKYQFKGLPFSAWLYRVAYNELMDVFRKHKSKKVIQVPVDELIYLAAETEEDNLLENEQKLARLKKVLPELKPAYIELVQLRFFEGKSFKEIGDILGLTEANAKMKTHRVLKKIASMMQ